MITKILGIANEVMSLLGPGMPEAFYREIFTKRLNASGLDVKVKPRGVLRHRDKTADEFIPDFLVEKSVVINIFHSPSEFNSAQTISTGSAQKFFSATSGLMLDFSRSEVNHRRLGLSHDPFPTIPYEDILRANPVEKHDEMRAAMLCRSILHIGRAQGLGFGESTYRGLLRVEFDAESLDYEDEPMVPITIDGVALGDAKLSHIMSVQRSGALLVTAQQEGIRNSDKAKLHHALKYLKLPWGLIVHFGRRRFEWQWVK